MRRRLVSVTIVALAVAATLGGVADAATGKCTATSGVRIVVDYGAAGVRGYCAPGDPVSGLAALTAAGLAYTFVPRQPGLVCTINAVPDPCNGAPVTAYWAYWHGTAARTWAFSDVGAAGFDPAPGSVEGWAFGASRAPRVRPPG